MTPNEVFAKDIEERSLERKSAAELWGRSWKGELLLALKTEHAELCAIHEAHLRRFPRLETEPTAEDERAGKLAKIAWEILRDTREQMMSMALHPTRPKAEAPSRGGGRPRKNSDPIAEAEVVAIVPRGTSDPASPV